MSLIIWPIRIFLYLFAAWLGMWIIFPAVGGGMLGILLAAPTASLALGLDILVSSKLRRESIEKDVARRVLILDRVLSSEPQENRPSLGRAEEVEVEEILPAETNYPQLPNRDDGRPRF